MEFTNVSHDRIVSLCYFSLLPFSISSGCKNQVMVCGVVSQSLHPYLHVLYYSVYSQNSAVRYHLITLKSQFWGYSRFNFIRFMKNCRITELTRPFWNLLEKKLPPFCYFIQSCHFLNTWVLHLSGTNVDREVRSFVAEAGKNLTAAENVAKFSM